MRVYGIDFTSAPGRRKPLVAVDCSLENGVLRAESSEEMTSLDELEEFLGRPGYILTSRPVSYPTKADTERRILCRILHRFAWAYSARPG